MGSSYSISDVVDPRLDTHLVDSFDREQLHATFGSGWSIDDVGELHTRLTRNNPAKDLKKLRKVRWPFLFETLEACGYHVQCRLEKERREKFHPACSGYAMTVDSILGHKLQHGDLEPLEEVESSENRQAEEKLEEDRLKEIAKDDENEEDDENVKPKDGGENPKSADDDDDDSVVSRISVGDDDEKKNNAKVAKELNAKVTNPIFFGYKLISAEEQDEENRVAFEEDWKSVEKVEDNEGEQLQEEAEKMKERHERWVSTMTRNRTVEWKKIEKERNDIRSTMKREREAARKAMADKEYAHFIRDSQKQEQDHETKWKQEDEERKKKQHIEDHNEEVRFKKEWDENAKKQAGLIKEKDTPKGEKLVRQVTTILQKLRHESTKLKMEMNVKHREMQEAIRAAGDKADKNPHRSMIMVAESEYKKANEAYEESVQKVVDQETELKNAQALERREGKYISLYHSLVELDTTLGNEAFSMDITSVIVVVLLSSEIVLEKKLKFIFNLFCDKKRKGQLVEEELAQLFIVTVRAMENLGGCLMEQHKDEKQQQQDGEDGVKKRKRRRRKLRRCSAEFLKNLAKRQFDLVKKFTDQKKQSDEEEEVLTMTEYEFNTCVTQLIKVSQDLSNVFQVPWKYANMSKWQLVHMSYVKKFELGLLTLEQLNWKIAQLWTTYRPQLSHERKLELHERALAMGANDPLKPTYAKFLVKRKGRLQSDVVPLEHGSLGNLIQYHQKQAYNAAMLVQAAWRSKTGRRKAEAETKRRAFFSAWRTAKEEARDKVEGEFQKREEQPSGSVGRMKWDATVRMRQVKLRAKGQNLSREEVVRLLIEEDVQVAHEEVNQHFEKMKKERGLLNDQEMEALENAKKKMVVEGIALSEEQLKSNLPQVISTDIINVVEPTEKELIRTGRRKQRLIKRNASKEFLQRLGLEKHGWDPDDPKTYEIELEDEPPVNLDNLNYYSKEGDDDDRSNSKDDDEDEKQDKDDSSDAAADDDDDEREEAHAKVNVGDVDPYVEEKKQEEEKIKNKMQLIPAELPSISLPKPMLNLSSRKRLMEYGAELESFYSVGLREDEAEFLFSLRQSDPAPSEYQRRLREIGSTMTLKKVEELMEELPSKQLLIRFLNRYKDRPMEDLENELVRHFGLLRREVKLVARILRAIAYQDFENGKFRHRAIYIVNEIQSEVRELSKKDLVDTIKEIDVIEQLAQKKLQSQLENAKRKAQAAEDELYDGDDDDGDSLNADEQDSNFGDEDGNNMDEALTEAAAKTTNKQNQRDDEKEDGEDEETQVDPYDVENILKNRTKTDDSEEGRDPTPFELALEDLETRRSRVDQLRSSVFKVMRELENAEFELERAERKRKGFAKRMDDQQNNGTQSKAREEQDDDIALPPPGKLDRKLSRKLSKKMSFMSSFAGGDEEGGNDDDFAASIMESRKKRRQVLIDPEKVKTKQGWLSLKRFANLKGLGVGTKGTDHVGSWFNSMEQPRLDITTDSHRCNWMARYSAILDKEEDSPDKMLAKYSDMFNLFDDFLQTATAIGKTIIMERFLPMERKSIFPFRSRPADVGRGDHRYYYKAANIHFKFATDEDGLCNGSDEFAAKYHGHSIRNSIAFQKCHLGKRVIVPFEAMIDYNGTRLHASAHLPVEFRTFDPKGNLKRTDVEIVLGSEDRGEKIHSGEPSLDRLLAEAASKLCLGEHGVKGSKDLLPKYLVTPADLRGFRDFYAPKFYLQNFRRLFPPEDPHETKHLPSSARSHSIFWRQLRPEWVQFVGVPQSSDAFSMFSLGTPDWQKHSETAARTTKKLIEERIPEYAEELSRRPIDEIMEADIVQELHVRGINLRHLGLLRSLFWHRIRGTVRVTFSDRTLVCTHDVTKEVAPGQQIRLRDEIFVVSADPRDPYDGESRTICIAREELSEEELLSQETNGVTDSEKSKYRVPLYSAHDVELFTGTVKNDQNSAQVRSLLLAEIVARSLKNMTRLLMRQVCETLSSPSDICMERVLLYVLNLISGSEDGSDEFWAEEVVSGVLERFGSLALSELEKLNLRVILEDEGVLFLVVKKFLAGFNASLTTSCLERFKASCGVVKGCACSFVFSASDIENVRCRVKHNLYYYEFCRAMILASKANKIRNATYESIILKEHPTGYWPLAERPGARITVNRGATGLRLSGKVHGCRMGEDGIVLNQWPNRSFHFPLYREGDGDENFDLLQSIMTPKASNNNKEGKPIPTSAKAKPNKSTKVVHFRSTNQAGENVDAEEEYESPVERHDSDEDARLLTSSEEEEDDEEEGGEGDRVEKDGDGTTQNATRAKKNKKNNRKERLLKSLQTDEGKKSNSEKKNLYLAHARVDTEFHRSIVPQDRLAPFSVESWARAGCGDGKERYIVCSGRYALLCNRNRGFSFVIMDSKFAVEVELSSEGLLLDNKWHHLVGTFDGTMASFYVDAVLVERVDYDEMIRELSRGYDFHQANLERKRREKELQERNNAAKMSREEAQTYFKTKMGQIYLSTAIKKHMSRSEAKIKLNKEKAKILGLKPITKSEARLRAINEWVCNRTCEHLERITTKHRKLIQKHGQLRERRVMIAQDKAQRPLRIGAGFASTGGPKGCFFGNVQHVAVYETCLSRDAINIRFLTAKKNSDLECERLFNESAFYFDQALRYCYDDDVVLEQYANAMTQRAVVDSDKVNNVDKYLDKMRKNLRTFENKANAKGIASLVKSLPDMPIYAPFVVDCWNAILRIDSEYYGTGSQIAVLRRKLRDLEAVPERFDLNGSHALGKPSLLNCAADMFSFVLSHQADFYGPYVGSVDWIAQLRTPSLIVYLVNKVKHVLDNKKKQDQFKHFLLQRSRMSENLSAIDKEELLTADSGIAEAEKECQQCLYRLDFREASEIQPDELELIGDNVRVMDSLSIPSCHNLTTESLCNFVQKCKFLHTIVMSGCNNSVDDDVLLSLSENCVSLRSIDVSDCHQVSDPGLAVLARKCVNLRSINLSHCELISDVGLVEAAPHLRKLECLNISWCIMVTNGGMFKLAQKLPNLLELDISHCRRISDDGIVAFTPLVPKLTSFKVAFCNKITDEGAKAITHNLLQLKHLDLTDLYQITDKPFFFDATGDGRSLVDQTMFNKLLEIKLSDCKSITDHAIAEIARRASNIALIDAHGCVRLTDQAINVLTKCPITGMSRGNKLVTLDLTFCTELTGQSLNILGENCPLLQKIGLSGCVKLSDRHIRKLCIACSGLQSIAVAHCKNLSIASIEAMSEYLWVEELDISYCTKMNDDVLSLIAENFPGMISLNIAWCRKMSDHGLAHIAESCKSLETLTIVGCQDKFSRKVLGQLARNCLNCKIITE